MENNKNHIDNFLRDKMQDVHFDLNEAHWNDAERRLDENDDKKKPFLLFFIVGFVLIGLGTAAYKIFNPANRSNPIVTHEVTNTNDKEETLVNSNNTNQESTNTIQPIQEEENTQPILYNNSERTEQLKNKAVVQSNEQDLTTEDVLGHQKKTKRTTSLNNIKPKSKRRTLVAKTTDAQSQDSGSKKTIDNTTKDGTPVSRGDHNNKPKKGFAGVKKPLMKQMVQDKNEPFKPKSPISVSNNGDNTFVVRTPNPNKNKAAKNITIYKTADDYKKMNPRYVDGLEGYTFKIDKIKLTTRESDSIRELVAKQNAPTPPDANVSVPVAADPKKTKAKQEFVQQPSSFFILAGLAAARGYIGNSGEKANYGMSPSLGTGYQYNFSKRMSLYLSIYMSYLNHLNITESSMTVAYSFKKDSTLISVSRKNLLQLHIPLQLAYKLKPRHSIYGGLGINLGLSTISLYEDSRENRASRKFGYTSGLSFMDINTNIGYEYMMRPKLSLGLFYQQGLRDMTKNNYFTNQQIDRNSRIGFSLRYKF